MTREKYGVNQNLTDDQKKLLRKLAQKDEDELEEADKRKLKKLRKEAGHVKRKGNVLATEEGGTEPFEQDQD